MGSNLSNSKQSQGLPAAAAAAAPPPQTQQPPGALLHHTTFAEDFAPSAPAAGLRLLE